jgi:Flp pilus assembly protein TadD
MSEETPQASARERRLPPPAERLLERLKGLRSAEQARGVLPLLPRLVKEYAEDHQVQRALSETALRAGDVGTAVDLARRAYTLEPTVLGHQLHLAICLLSSGEQEEAIELLKDARTPVWNSAYSVSLLASLLVRADCHEEAVSCYERAVALEPENARHHFSLAATYRFLGRLDDAELACDRAIALDPREYEAYLVRSDLRTQTAEHNHVSDIEAALNQIPDAIPYMGETMLCFAIAKECEDLGDSDKAFSYLRRGANLRRKHLSYDVAHDVEIMAELTRRFTPEYFASCPAEQGVNDGLPLFVIGMPRTGTTLLERMLDSHSRIASAGELPDFPQLVGKLGQAASREPLGPRELVAASLDFDMAELGSKYLDSVRRRANDVDRLLDKLPFNYLNIGLIHRALPESTMIHVSRDPMDTCYAVYKTLFQRAYPFSYDLNDLARYFIAYWQLMEHWRSVLPGRILEVRYEDLVEHPELEAQRLITACGLSWEPAMSNFHHNPTASMTASASQVRRPVYRSSVGKWRRYEQQLRPLVDKLQAAGIPVSS